ncbi:uncharacterized protein LOC130547006 [Triplophysa rosa]|uniref:uncharacterized protein LOC130547006 n=1 Tax=Triplophysa rosa TaxID=992332 RepID=UPI00254630E2|nr:uncharacterized protein LOC130547006 [Triplophysa rosa]
MERVQMMLCLFLVSTRIKPSVSVRNVPGVFVVARSETELTLGWYDDNSNCSYILRGSHGDQHINSSEYLGGVVTHTVSSLSPGTEYTFTVFTVFEGAQSSGDNFTTVTSPSNVKYVHTWQRGVRSSGYNVTVVTGVADVESVSVLNCTENEITMEWNKVHNINNYVLVILIDNVHNFISGSDHVSVVRHTVSSLHPGWVHRFILCAVLNREMSDGYLFHAATAPQNVDGVTVQRQKDTSIMLKFSDTKHVLGNRHFYILQYGEIEAYMGLHNDDRNYDGFIYRYGPNTEPFLEGFFDHYYEDTYTVTSPLLELNTTSLSTGF